MGAAGRRRRRWRRRRGRGGRPDHYTWDETDAPISDAGSHGIFRVSNVSLEADGLKEWLDSRHRMACKASTPVYFVPFSPNGIGNKLMAMVMGFHIALMQRRALVISDWPPSTLSTSYKLEDIVQPSSCQLMFDGDKSRPKVRKCTVAGCPLRTASRFTDSRTQPHWAHQSPDFLDLPKRWKRLDWLTWWRAITQYLFQPGAPLLQGLQQSLGRATLLRSPGAPGVSQPPLAGMLRRAASEQALATAASPQRTGFAARFAGGVARWEDVRRPLVGVHVRLGDGCGDLKRGGCKYVRSFAGVVSRLREAGISAGTIFLATDGAEIAAQATAAPVDGFDVLTLREDRAAVQASHSRGERRREADELLHLQLLDLALLSQADVLAGVFASTFVKSALQLGAAAAYVSLDTFAWCPLLRCFWHWRDLCHNCEVCTNQAGAGEACTHNGYHTANGMRRAVADKRDARAAFRDFHAAAKRHSHCVPLADHPLGATMYDAPVVNTKYAEPLPPHARPTEVCSEAGGAAAATACACGFRRLRGVDNAYVAQAKPFYGYGTAAVTSPPPRSLAECERRCCEEPTCHSVTWLGRAQSCVASLTIAHGARPTDWCWHPKLSDDAVTSLRLAGAWEQRAISEGKRVLAATTLVRTGNGTGPRVYRKLGRWFTPSGHTHPLERSIEPVGCEAAPRQRRKVEGGGGGAIEVSDLVVAAIPVGDPRPGKGGKPRDPGCGPASFLRQTHPNAGNAYPAS